MSSHASLTSARPAKPTRPGRPSRAGAGSAGGSRRARSARAASTRSRVARRLAALRRWLRWPRISALLRRLLAVVLGAAALAWSAGPVYAQVAPGTLPTGGTVVTGSGVLSSSGQTLSIHQSSARLGIDWQSFSIGRDALVEFLQPGPGSIALNRVVGHESSQIYGRLRANGQVFLTNANGVLFAPGAKVDVGGLVASTLDLTQADFAAGRDRFVARDGASGAVVNEGELTARAGGYLALFGPTVDNRGDLRVDAGSVVLASGRAATVSISGSGLLSAVIDPGVAGAVLNSGRIAADGGSVTLNAASAEVLASSLVNNSGIVRANSIEERAGQIWITGDRVESSGRIQADAHGSADAGRVTIKGGMQSGSLVLGGQITATAEGGRGGQVETSAAQVKIDDATSVTTLSDSRQHGTWLIDPSNFTVAAGSGALTSSGIGAATLSSNLDGGNVTLMTAPEGAEAGDLFVNAPVSWSASTLLTLSAARHVEINADITATGGSAGLAVNPAGTDATGVFTMASGARVRLPGANSGFSLGGTAYTMVRNLAELRAIDGSATVLGGNYALADAIDASETATVAFSPIGNEATASTAAGSAFTGRFQGLGNPIGNLSVDQPASNATGLFATLNNARVDNLRLEGGSVRGSQFVGALAGVVAGSTQVTNVHSDLAVSAVDDSSSGVYAGGLLGSSPIGVSTTVGVSRSSSSGAVSVDTNTTTAQAGGVIGRLSRGTLANLSASGAVTATLRSGTNDAAFYIGGLAGYISSTVVDSSASGNVSGGHESGGLVGRFEAFNATISGSSASGNVTGTGQTGGLVGHALVASGSTAALSGINTSSASGRVTSTGYLGNDGLAGGAVGHYDLSTAPVGLSASGDVTALRAAGGVIGFLERAGVVLSGGSISSTVPSGETRDITAQYWAGGLVGYSNATAAMDGLSFSGNVSTTGSVTEGAAGGLVGRAAGPITNGTTSGSVSGVLHAGGIVGFVAGTGGVSGATSSAIVSGTGNTSGVGGIAGWINSGSLTGSSFTGSVNGGGHVGALAGRMSNGSISGNTTTVSSVSGALHVGGLVGYIAGATLSDLTSTISVTHTGNSGAAGSLAGYMAGTIANSSASGTVTSSGSGNISLGGLVGEVSGGVTDSSASGTVTLPSSSVNGSVGGLVGLLTGTLGLSGGSATGPVSGGDAAGGLVGRFTATSGATISGSTASGNVGGAGSVGGLVGVATGTGAITGSSATGAVTTSAPATASYYAGGSVGHYNLSTGPSGLSAAGNVSGGNSTGGVIGYLQTATAALGSGSLVSVVPEGEVKTVSGPRWVGGLVGYSNSGAEASGLSFAGQVEGTAGSGSTGAAGGLFGRSGGAVSGSSSSGSVTGFNMAGGLVGYAEGSGAFSNLSSSAVVTGGAGAFAGGLVGWYASTGSMSTVSSSASVSGGSRTGGLVGNHTGGSVSGATHTGASVTGTEYVGGLFGLVAGASIDNATASATVLSTTTGSATIHVGGLAGRTGGAVSNATASGSVTASATAGTTYAGGLIGLAQGTGGVSDASASGDVVVVSSGTASSAGGLIGYVSAGSLTRGTATGSVSGGFETGGLVGRFNPTTGTLRDSSASGNVSGRGDAGGLVGHAEGTGAILDSSAAGQVSSSGGSPYSVGGVVGYTQMTLGVGNLSTTSTIAPSGGSELGGVIGELANGTASGLTTPLAAIEGSTWVGGLIGYASNTSLSGLTSAVAVTQTGTSGGAGGVVGYLSGSIAGSTATGTVSATATSGTVVVGGLAGEVDVGAVSASSASGAVSGGSETGGLVGRYNPTGGSLLSGSSAGGTVSGRGSVGGLVGEAAGAGGIASSSATGSVSTTGSESGTNYAGGAVGRYNLSVAPAALSAAGNVSGGNSTGGVVGYLEVASVTLAEGSLVSVVPEGSTKAVTGPRWVGGLVGYSNATGLASDLSFAGEVTATGSAGAVGGLFGRSAGPIADSSSSGSVSAVSGQAGGLVGQANGAGGLADVASSAAVTASGNGNVGGLVGLYQNSGTLERATASGAVAGGSITGGLVGYFDSGAAISAATYTGSSVAAGSFASGTVYLGGLLGYSRSTSISGATATVDLSNASTATLVIGGLAGRTGGAVSDSSAGGDVSATAATGVVHAGGLIGQAEGTGALTGVSASGNVAVASATNNGSAGGLVGTATSGSIGAATASGNVSGQRYTGGLVGRFAPGTGSISNSSATGGVQSLGDAGGLVGFASATGSIRDSSAGGSVFNASSSTFSVGGAIGYASMSAGVSNVSASGSVGGGSQTGGVIGESNTGPLSGLSTSITSISGSTWVGGLVGVARNGSLTGLVSAVNVTHTGSTGGAGGVVGYSSSSISGGGASGSVTATSSSGSVYVGGLAGEVDVGSVTGTSASGAVSGGSDTGGLIGRFDPTGGSLLSGSSASGNVSGRGSVGGLVGESSGTGGITTSSATGTVTSSSTGSGNVGGAVGYYNLSIGPTGLSAAGNVSGGSSTGGVIGQIQSGSFALAEGSLVSVVPEGTVKSVSGSTWVGGLVGYSSTTGAASDLSFAGVVTATATGGAAGGLFGRSNGAVNNSSSSGSVSGLNEVGGLVGLAQGAGGFSGVSSTANVSTSGTGSAYVGGLVGQYSNSGTLSGGTATGSVTHSASSGSGAAGGLVGFVGAGSISGGNASGNVSGGLYAGGLVGRFSPSSGSISGSQASGNVSSRGDAGGLVGFASGTGSINTSSAFGSVTSSDTSGYSVGGAVGYTQMTGGVTDVAVTGVVSGGAYAGAIVGNLQGSGAVFTGNSTTATSVSGHVWVGGLVGYSTVPLSGLMSAVTVTHLGSSGGAGGIVGYINGALTDSSASGNVSSGASAGGVAGNAVGSGARRGLVASGQVSTTSTSGSHGAGGLIGVQEGGSLSDSEASGSVSGGYYSGGLVGYAAFNGNIDAVSASGAVSTTVSGANVGGLIGYAGGSGTFTDASATGDVTASSNSSYVGGLVGQMQRPGGMTGASATGAVTGGTYVGGLIGYMGTGGLENLSASGNVVAANTAGGLVGYAYAIADAVNLSASGTVQGDNTAGGLFGQWWYGGSLSDSIATGAVLAGSQAGGLIGQAYSMGGINNGRASGDVRGGVYVGGLVGYAAYTNISNGTASGSVTGIGSGFSTLSAGGLVGRYEHYNSGASLRDSVATGAVDVDGYGSYSGGLVGYFAGGELVRTRAEGSVLARDSSTAGSSNHYGGGLVGYYVGYRDTDAFQDNQASGDVTAAGSAGGLVGYYQSAGARPSGLSASGDVTGRSNVGGLIGELLYTGLQNASASGRVSNVTGSGTAGGLVGRATAYYGDSSISDGRASGDVSGGNHAGGLVGWYSDYYYSTSSTSGIIASAASGAVSGATVAGGLVGRFEDSGYYAGTALVRLGVRDSRASGDVQARHTAGGLVGQFYGSSSIRGSLASGDVLLAYDSQNTAHAGGLVGEFQSYTFGDNIGRIVQSTASGSVTQTVVGTPTFFYAQYGGGLAGRLNGSTAGTVVVQDSYATGQVALDSRGNTVHAGGLVGSTNASLERTYATGAVSAAGVGGATPTLRTGGLVGWSERAGTAATASYWATDTTGQATSALGTASTLEAMRSSATFEGWDIATVGGSDSVWRQYEGRSLPLLRNFLSPLTIVLTDVSRVYDGTTGLGVDPIMIGDVLVNNPSAITVFGDARNVGAYTITGDNLTSTQGGYDLVLDGSATLTISQRPLTLSGVVLDKVYDGTTAATLASSPALGNLVPGEDLRFLPGSDFAAAFETRSAGANKTVVLAGSYSITDGTVGLASNYQLPTGLTTTATITPRPVTVGAITAVDRVYDGTTAVVVNAEGGTLSGVLDGDVVSFDASSVTSGTIPTPNAGTRPVSVSGALLSGADAGNYQIAGLDGVTVLISPKQLTMNGLVAGNRAYNSGTSVSVSGSGASLSGIVAGDLVLPEVSSLAGRMADKNVGDGKPVTVTGAALRGPDAGNYTVVPGDVTVNITPYLLTVQLQHTGSPSRVYDGTTNASVYFPNWYWYGSDDLTVSAASIGFADKNVAYDGSGNVTHKTITASGITLAGADAGNYALQNTTATINGTITPKPLSVSGVTAVNRVYDGTRDVLVDITSAVVDLGGVVSGDEVIVSTPGGGGTVTGQMANKNVGTNKPVTVPGLALAGTDAPNYSITAGGSGVTVTISAKDLTATYTALDKVYDGNGNAVVTATLDGVVSGDSVDTYVNLFCTWVGSGCAYFVNEGGTPGSFTQNRNVGTDKPVVVTYNDLRGTDANNYRLVNATGSAAPADVTPKPVTLVFSGGTRVYDGTTAATVTLNVGGSGLYSVDGITSTQTAVFTGDGAKNVGSSKPIAVSDIVASGAGLANYTILNTTATASGRITPKAVVVSGIDATNRAYDGTTTVAVTVGETVGSTGFIEGDSVSVTLPAEGLSTGSIATPGVGTAKPVTVSGLGLAGTDAPNYSIDLTGSGITVDITPRLLTPTFSGLTKTYDGGINASVVSTTEGIVAGDTLSFSQVALFTGPGAKNVGNDKPIAISAITLGGASAANYGLATTTASTTGNVVPKSITPVYTGGSRVYSGVDVLTAPVTGGSSGFIGTDAVGLSQTALFTGDGSAGTGKPVSVSDILLVGADAGNYVLSTTTASTTATVTPRPLSVAGVTAASRVYDGTTEVAVNVSGATVDISNVIPGDSVGIALPPDGITTGNMADRFVGSAKPVTIGGASLSGSSAANYVLTGASGLTVNITPRPLTASYTALDKVYDGTANATVVATPADLLAIDAGAVGVLANGVFSDGRNAGVDKTVAVSGGYLTGAFASNYLLANSSGSATADITPRLLGVGYGSIGKVYDGTADVAVTASLSGRIAGDVVGATQTAVFTGDGAKNVGSGKPVAVTGITLTGADAGNYRLDSDSLTTTGRITPRPITISGLTSVVAIDRVYDGSTTVGVLVPEGVTLTPGSSDIIPGDIVSIAVPGSGLTTGTMANKNAGTGKAVAITGLSLSGDDAGNYVVAGTAGVTVDIAPLGITALWTGVNRIYDGSTAAQASGSSDGVITGDSLLIRASGSFSDGKNVGTAKPITLSGGLLSGADAGNYVLLNPTGTATADVTPRTLTASYAAVSKVYDGGVAAPVSAALSGLVAGDAVSATQTAVFTGSGARNVGSGKTVSIAEIALAGADAGNYLLAATTASTTGSITPRPLTLVGLTGVSAVDRVYDGTTSVVVSLSSTGPVSIDPGSIVAGDEVGVTSLSGSSTTGTMADKHVGTAKPVIVDGLALTGADAGNYAIAATEGVTVNITPRSLTAVYAGVDKVYDGTAAASVLGSSADILAGDSVSIGGSAVFSAGRNAGTGLVVAVTAGALSGGDARNYLLANPTGSTTASILPKTLSVSYSGGTRVYDGTVLAPVSGLLGGLIEGDTVTLSQSAVFTGDGAKNVGSGKAVAVSGIALGGSDAGNYQLSGDSAVTTASITPRPLRIVGLTGVTAVDRVYDGTREVQVNVATSGPITPEPGDLIEGDEVTLTAPPTGSTTGLMADKHVGSNKPVAVSGLEIGGADAANYSVAETAGVTVSITPKSLTPTFVGTSRVYDGTTAASAGGFSADIVAGDSVLILASGVFTGDGARNAGLNKPVSITSALLGGADGGNYVLSTTTGSTTADITPRLLTASYTGIDRTYDGSTAATVTRSVLGLVDGDSVAISESAAFTDGKNVGTAKPVLVSGIALGGADAGNYLLGAATASTTANVTPRLLTISGLSGLTVTDRVYDGTLEVAVSFGTAGGATGASNIVPGDDVSVAFTGEGGARMLDKHAGNAKPVTLTGLTVTGADAANYAIGGVEGLSVNIAPRPVTLAGVLAVDRVYDGSTLVAIDRTGATISGAIAGDLLEVAASASGSMADKHVGTAKPVSVAGLALAGADAGNYVVVDSAPISVNITPRTLSAVFAGLDKVYDGTTAASVSITAAGLVEGDAAVLSGTAVFIGAGARNAGSDKPIGISDLLLSGADAGNYLLATTSGTASANILPRTLSADVTVAPRVYDGTTTASVSLVSSGVIDGDAVTLSGTATYTGEGAKNVGVDKPVTVADLTLGGADAGNYTLGGLGSIVTTGSITPRPLLLAISALDKVYDGETAASVSIVSDRIAGDDLVVAATAASFAQADAGSGLRVNVGALTLAGADRDNYALPGTLPEVFATIRRAPLLVTAGTLEKIYGTELVPLGTEFSASGLVGSQTVGSVTLASAGLAALQPVGGSPYALVASGASGGSFNPANYDISYRDGAVLVRPRTVTISSDFVVAFENELDDLAFGASVSGLLPGLGHGVAGLVPPAPDLRDAIGGSRITLLHSGGSITGTEAGNYTLRYEAGRLIVLPRPVLLSDQPEVGDGGFGIGSFTQEELDAASAALDEAVRMLNAPPPADGVAGPGLQLPGRAGTLTAAEIASLFGTDARQITLPALQRLPLISFDAALRRLLGAPPTP